MFRTGLAIFALSVLAQLPASVPQKAAPRGGRATITTNRPTGRSSVGASSEASVGLPVTPRKNPHQEADEKWLAAHSYVHPNCDHFDPKIPAAEKAQYIQAWNRVRAHQEWLSQDYKDRQAKAMDQYNKDLVSKKKTDQENTQYWDNWRKERDTNINAQNKWEKQRYKELYEEKYGEVPHTKDGFDRNRSIEIRNAVEKERGTPKITRSSHDFEINRLEKILANANKPGTSPISEAGLQSLHDQLKTLRAKKAARSSVAPETHPVTPEEAPLTDHNTPKTGAEFLKHFGIEP